MKILNFKGFEINFQNLKASENISNLVLRDVIAMEYIIGIQ